MDTVQIFHFLSHFPPKGKEIFPSVDKNFTSTARIGGLPKHRKAMVRYSVCG
jgi:hypothetical protein